ncbi:MAG: helix-turn-helix domain-containing protein [Thermoplasmata archaeon]|nr:helix-turn-helix domain-containing protein [Thermoplasmata archaeon]
MVNQDFVNNAVKNIFKPGAVIVSYGTRGGGKTHCAVSFCQRLMEGYFPDMPKHVILISNVIFIQKTIEGGFRTASPPGVYSITTMKELFPIVANVLEKYGRKDTLIILLLDEAQNFLMGDMNSSGDMAKSMKSFCGIIRKFNLALWLLSPAMRNLGPAFRNFIDAENDPANVTCTFQKNNKEAEAFIRARRLNMDPRSIVYVKMGANDPRVALPVPTSSWTSNPEEIRAGEYAYDHLSSADFKVGDFPFLEFVYAISGRSSYEMIDSIRAFYSQQETEVPMSDSTARANKAIMADTLKTIATRLKDEGVDVVTIADALGVKDRTIYNWVKEVRLKEKKQAEKSTEETA